MNEKKLNTEFTPSKDDFQLVQRDMKIKDQKFQTKTTTFAKDAFKRFCKNKSSVVGAIIIGILLLCSLIFPIVLPYNVNKPDPNQTLLIPKLFENNNGFWDGTKKYSNVVYNRDTQCPEGYHPTAVIKDSLVLSVDEVIDLKNADATTYQATAYGGYFKFIGEKIQEGYDPAVNTKRIENKTLFDITSDGGYYVNFSFGNVDIIQDGTTYTKQAKYKISLMQGKTVVTILKDWSDDYSDQSFDLSKVLSDNGKTELKGCSIKLEIYRDFEVETHVLIKQLIIGAKNVTDEEQLALLNEISINDPCDTFFMKKNDAINLAKIKYRPNDAKDILMLSIPSVASRIIGNVCYFFEPIILTNCLLKTGYSTSYILLQYGAYNAYAISTLTIPSFFITAIASALIPEISKFMEQEKYFLVKKRLKQAFIFAFLIGLSFTFIIFIFRNDLLSFLYNTTLGSEYIKLLAPFFILFYFEAIFAAFMQAMGKVKITLRITIITSIIKLGCIAGLSLLKIGIYALLFSEIINILLVVLLNYIMVQKLMKAN